LAPTSPATADSSKLQTLGEAGKAADQERALKLPDSRGFGGYQAGPAGGLPGGMGGMGGGGFGGGRAGGKPVAKNNRIESLAEGIPAESLSVQKTTGQESFGVEVAKAAEKVEKPASSLGFQFQASQGNPTPVELPPRTGEPVTLVESHMNLVEARAKAKPAANFSDASWKTAAKTEAEMPVVAGAVELSAASGLALDNHTGLPLANQTVEKNQENPGLLNGPMVATASAKPADGEPAQTAVLGDTPMLGRLFRSESRKSQADAATPTPTPTPPADLAGEAAGKEVDAFSRQSEGRNTKGVETLRPEPAATPGAGGETRARFAAKAGAEKKLAAMDSREVRRGLQESDQAGDAVAGLRQVPAKPQETSGDHYVLYDLDGDDVVKETGRPAASFRADPNTLISGLENAGSIAAAPAAGNGNNHQFFFALKDAKPQPAREAVALDFNGFAGNIDKLSGSLDGSVIANGLIATNSVAAEFNQPAALAQLMKADPIQRGKDLPAERFKQDAKASQPAPPAGAPAAAEEGKQAEATTRRNRLAMNPTMMQRYGLLTAPAAPALAAPASEPAARPEIGLQGGSPPASPAPQNQPMPAPAATEPPQTGQAAKTRGPTPVPQPETQTTENAFSTFSLNVADVSFKLAMTSLNQNTLPDPASVRSEEFVNAFQYRDPEPAPGSSIAFAWERARYPFAHDRELLRLALRTAAQGREPGRPLNLVLLLDNSGSMERADRVRIIRECLQVLAAQLKPTDRISVLTFARTAHLLLDGLPGNQAGQIAGRVSQLTPGGGTNLEEALNLAYATARRHFLEQGVNRVVMLTDGAANLGNVNPQALKAVVEAQRRAGIALDCFGIGWEGYNDDLLENLSRNGDGRYGFVNDPSEAATGFAGQLAGALQVAASDVKVQVEFNPRRVTAYRQIGYAKHQLKKEQFRDNTVDAAELGAAETGNALYVLQVNPRGEGNLGTVRARYKIPGTSEYRENQWPLPCPGTAPALETASPALRLAATAAAFSEWLVSSPFAAEVTPDKLLALLQGVPAAFEPNKRPGQLEWMIRQARAIGNR
jgi:Mg-chelatase subunit ChlD